jgi:hypothetical protein
MKRILLALILLACAPAFAAISTRLPQTTAPFAALAQSDYVEGRALAAATAERITIPQSAAGVTAAYVLFSCTDNFAAKIGSSAVTAAMPIDTTDGTGSMLNPTMRAIPPGSTSISIISTNASQCTMEFFLP